MLTLRVFFTALLLTAAASAQLPRGFYAWWSSPVAKDLNLSPEQQKQIREVIKDYRPRLMQLRGELDESEQDLELQFNHDPIDNMKTNKAIERLVTARGDLTRTLSHMSLQLRSLLTEQQWADLQRRRPLPANAQPAPTPSGK